jgi:mannose-6-phosphate isomerase-like protein (cupin superfamily)
MNMRKPIQKSISEIEKEPAHDGSGARQLLLSKEDAVSSQFEAATKGFLNPGNEFDWHGHEGVDELWIVLQGEGFIEYRDGTKFNYKTDDVIYNPSGLEHRIVAEGEEQSIYYFFRFND